MGVPPSHTGQPVPTARRVCTPQEAAALVRSGDTIAISANANTPRLFLEALFARAAELAGVEIMHMRLVGSFPAATPELAQHIRFNPLLVPEALRSGVAAGYVDYTPAHFHQISALFADGPRQLDVAVVAVAPPAADGTCSYGAYVGFMDQARQVARTVIAEVNAQMPDTAGATRFPLACADAVLLADYPLPENPRPVMTDVERQLGAHVAALIRDGDCLQVGGGAVPAAVAECLTARQDLGIHTELFTDWMVDLIEQGCINGARKNFDRGKVVTSFCRGTQRLYAFIHNNPQVEFHPIEYTNDPYRIGLLDNVVAINAAVQIDLTGQVNSESLGTRQMSGTGGLVDFVRGAARSQGGRSIIAIPSTALGGTVSRIVPAFEPGTAVTVLRAEAHWIVTEYGACNLRGMTLRERARALIDIAHPAFREPLTEAARARRLLA
ncbi:MAG: acetyl-CoA hydrolase/transferase family protein [Candidatus Tectomicrobia bacterium]|uniref:Acetyl-CoA hydrolase/transferase family protein n=1 Tax=Tectimicrobiota bacterium TaxID=2528274 RepID=A0A937W7T2_UNCTE|nr:acetyl-CoA hydrolase/transferase family protein [Candidatus Tectomicrobia bacterium]